MDAEKLMLLGFKHFQDGEYQKTIDVLTDAISVDPENVLLYTVRGECYRLISSYDLLIKEATKITEELDPYNVIAHNLLSTGFFKTGQYDLAITNSTNVIDNLDPENIDAYITRGKSYGETKLYKLAIADTTKVINDYDPQNIEAFCIRGSCYFNLGLYDLAISDMTLVIEKLDLKNFAAYIFRGKSYYKKKLYDLAISDATKVIESIYPDSISAYEIRGECYLDSGQYDLAIADSNEILNNLDSNNLKAYNVRGNSYRLKQKYDLAIVDATMVIENIDSNNVYAYNIRGASYNKKEDYDLAISDANKIINDLDKHDVSAFITRGNSFYNKGLYNQAISDSTIVIENLDSCNIDAYMERVKCYVKTKSFNLAIADTTIVIETLDSNNILAYSLRGESYRIKGLYEQAIKDLNYVVETLNHDDVFALIIRGQTYLDMYKANKENLNYNFKLNKNLPFNLNDLFLLAQADFFRSTYLSSLEETQSFKINIDIIINFFSQIRQSPFLLNQLFKNHSFPLAPLTYLNTIHKNELICNNIQIYINYLAVKQKSITQTLMYNRWLALTNYFMGNPIESYKIYDEIIDEEFNSISLMGQYYYINSAVLIGEPYEGLLSFALKQANEYLTKKETKDYRELYYAALLLTINEQQEHYSKAFNILNSIPSKFLPAQYMKVNLAIKAKYPVLEINKLIMNVRDQENRLPREEGYLNGVSTKKLDIKVEDYLTPLYYDIHYREIIEILPEVLQEKCAPHLFKEFWEVWKLDENSEAKIHWFFREQELKKVESELQSILNSNLGSKFYDEEVELKLLDNAFSTNKSLFNIFTQLQKQSNQGPKHLEHHLGLEIEAWELNNFKNTAHVYMLFLKYFYLKQKLENYSTFFLYFYIDYIALKKEKLNPAIDKGLAKAIQELFEMVQFSMLSIGKIPIKVISVVLTELSKQLWSEEKEVLEIEIAKTSYDTFKEKFLKHISYLKETLGQEKFDNRFPLKGFDDWKHRIC